MGGALIGPVASLPPEIMPSAGPPIEGYPAAVAVDRLNAEHAEYTNWKGAWTRYHDFYVGGDVLRRRAAEYLTKRQKEPAEVYMERVSRVTYENYLGSIIDWYAAALFRREPIVKLPDDPFYGQFVLDCDRGGKAFIEFLRECFTGALIYGASPVLIDFPGVDEALESRAEEDLSGRSRAYLVAYTPLDIFDWSRDGAGNYNWLKIKSGAVERPSALARRVLTEDCWTIFDRQMFARYEASTAEGAKSQAEAKLVDGPEAHATTHLGRVPICELRFPEGLWLANRAGLLFFEHFQKSNALAWALHMGLYAMPIVYSDSEFHQVLGEAYYLQLGKGDKFEWGEPAGRVHALAAENLGRLKDEIYRLCYLSVQATERFARNVAQSGESKRQDYRAVEEVLKLFGAYVKDFGEGLLRTVVEARGDDASAVAIQGLDSFDIRDLSVILQDAAEVNLLTRSSPTCLRETAVKVALAFHSDAPKDVKDRIVEELRIAPISILEEAALGKPTVRITQQEGAAQPGTEEQAVEQVTQDIPEAPPELG